MKLKLSEKQSIWVLGLLNEIHLNPSTDYTEGDVAFAKALSNKLGEPPPTSPTKPPIKLRLTTDQVQVLFWCLNNSNLPQTGSRGADSALRGLMKKYQIRSKSRAELVGGVVGHPPMTDAAQLPLTFEELELLVAASKSVAWARESARLSAQTKLEFWLARRLNSTTGTEIAGVSHSPLRPPTPEEL